MTIAFLSAADALEYYGKHYEDIKANCYISNSCYLDKLLLLFRDVYYEGNFQAMHSVIIHFSDYIKSNSAKGFPLSYYVDKCVQMIIAELHIEKDMTKQECFDTYTSFSKYLRFPLNATNFYSFFESNCRFYESSPLMNIFELYSAVEKKGVSLKNVYSTLFYCVRAHSHSIVFSLASQRGEMDSAVEAYGHKIHPGLLQPVNNIRHEYFYVDIKRLTYGFEK